MQNSQKGIIHLIILLILLLGLGASLFLFKSKFHFLTKAEDSAPPQVYLKFDLGSGGLAANSGTLGPLASGNFSNISNPPTADSGWIDSGKVNKSLNFDGINDSLNLGSDTSIDDMFTHDVTISAWIKTPDCRKVQYLAGKANGSASGFYIHASQSGCNPRITVYHAKSAATSTALNDSISPNKWHHLTFVWTAASKSAKIYVDGAEVVYGVQTAGVGDYSPDYFNNLVFGNYHTTLGNQYFKGSIDELRIYNFAQNKTQIQEDAFGKGAVGYYKLNEGSGTTSQNSGLTESGATVQLNNIANPPSPESGWTESGKISKAINLDGVNDTLNLGSNSSYDDLFKNDNTISFWIKPTSCNSRRYLAGKTNGGPLGFYIYSSDGACNPRLDAHFSKRRATFITSPNTIIPNQWNHITIVWNSTTQTATFYINDKQANLSTQTSGLGDYISDANANFILGNWHPTAGGPFYQGTIDEVQIFNYALPAHLINVERFAPNYDKPITVVRDSETKFLVRIQSPQDPEGVFAEWPIINQGGDNWAIRGLTIKDINKIQPDYILGESDSVWEYAFRIIRSDEEKPDEGEDATYYYGGGHGNIKSTNFAIRIDSQDIKSLSIDSAIRGSQVNIDQVFDILYPKNQSLVIGSVELHHKFNQDQLLVEHSHTYVPDYEIYAAHSGMLPINKKSNNPNSFNRVKIGDNPEIEIKNDGQYHYFEPASEALFYSTNHPYKLKLTLPSGGPDIHGDWSKATGLEKIWFYDIAGEYAKVYVNWVSNQWETRIPASSSSHQTKYQILK